MSSRDTILAAVRANKPAMNAPAPTVPSFDDSYPTERDALVAHFREKLELLGGTWLEPTDGQTLQDALRDKLAEAEVVVSNVPEYQGNRALTPETGPADLADVDTAILRARFGVAETGSVCFTEKELVENTVAYLAQHLIVLLDPAEIVTNIHRAYQRDDYQNAAYTVFHTGPSATADIEGVLVRGAQGVRSLTVIPASSLLG
jgi:L-lactate dehydrogenase complex protein LldG